MNRFSNTEINEAVGLYGGKIGILEALRGQGVQGVSIVPHVIMSATESLTEGKRRKIQRITDSYSARFGTDARFAMVRASIAGDEVGLIDVTESSPEREIKKIEYAIERVQESCKGTLLQDYARKEGITIADDNITIGIAPHIDGTSITITEHPNLSDVLLVDITEKDGWGHGHDAHTPTEFHRGAPLWVTSGHIPYKSLKTREQDITINASRIPALIRESGLFTDDEQLQYECVADNYGTIHLCQIRLIGQYQGRSYHNLKRQLESLDRSTLFFAAHNMRAFGVLTDSDTPQSYGVLHYEYFWEMEEKIRTSKKDRHATIVGNNSGSLGFAFPGENTTAYITPGVNRSMGHQNTRFVVEMMKRRGIALLGAVGLPNNIAQKRVLHISYDEQDGRFLFK